MKNPLKKTNNSNFNTGYKKRPFDSYKSLLNQLDEETKQKLDRQRTIGMTIIVAFVVLLIVILAVTGIGVDKTQSVSGNLFADKEHVLIECFGDSLTEGFQVMEEDGELRTGIGEVTYPKELEQKLTELFASDGNKYTFTDLTVKNYGQSGSVLQASSCARLSGSADIVLILYTANNFLSGEDYVGTLEANIETIGKQGGFVFLLNYPVVEGSPEEDKITQANNYIANTASAYSIPLIDLRSCFSSVSDYAQEELFGADQVHLTDLGYKLMGDYIAQFLHDYYYAMF